MALFFNWFISPRLKSKSSSSSSSAAAALAPVTSSPTLGPTYAMASTSGSLQVDANLDPLLPSPTTILVGHPSRSAPSVDAGLQTWIEAGGSGTPLNFLVLVTCYSESTVSIACTLDSLSLTAFPSANKILFLVCDGIVHGSGNDAPTPELVLSLMDRPRVVDVTGASMTGLEGVEYNAIASGEKSTNRAIVYVASYVPKNKEGLRVTAHRTPAVRSLLFSKKKRNNRE
jgi:hypothetical protein